MDIEGASGLHVKNPSGNFRLSSIFPLEISGRLHEGLIIFARKLSGSPANSRRLKFGLIEEFAFLCTEKLPHPVNLLNCGIFRTKMDLTFDSHRTTLKPRIL